MSETKIVTRGGLPAKKNPTTPKAPAAAGPPPGAFRVAIVDHGQSGAPDLATLQTYAAAMQKSLDRDFLPAYGKTAVVVAIPLSAVLATDRVLGLFADPDQPGALGYHDLSPSGLPYGKVFPLLDAQDGANLSTTIDHELKEMLEDATIDLARMGSDGHFWADEPCDAVEQDEYDVDGVKLSNFVLPAWYSGVTVGATKYDFLGTLSAPLTVDAGGYAQYFDPAQGWQQITDRKVKPRRYRRADFGRGSRRWHAAREAFALRARSLPSSAPQNPTDRTVQPHK